MKRGYDRAHRVADLLQKTLAPMLLQEMNDDRFRLVTITGVTVSRDLSFAKVHVSLLIEDEAQIKELVEILNDHAKALRYQLARQVDLRITPQLKFEYDDTAARGFHLTNLINAAMKKEQK